MITETRRHVPAVDTKTAAALERPAEAHVVVETWEEYRIYPDPSGFLAHCQCGFTQRRRVGFRREVS